MEQVERHSYTPFFDGVISDVVSVPLGEGRRLLFLSGVAAQDPDGKPFQSNVASGDIEAQIRHIWTRIGWILEQHGGRIRDIIKITTYVTDARHLVHPTSGILRELFAGGPTPVSTGLVVTALAYPEMLAEIEVTAVVG